MLYAKYATMAMAKCTMIAVWIVSVVVMARTPVCVCLDECTIAYQIGVSSIYF